MKITGSQVNSVSLVQAQKIKRTTPTAAPEVPMAADRIELSADANAIRTARAVIDAAPSVREDRVEALRQQIADGTYQVSAEKVADKILAEMRLAKLGQK